MSFGQEIGGYWLRDRRVVDYRPYTCPETGLRLRGPDPGPLAENEYFTCIGAAQTFGTLCETPYPALLSQTLGLPALNLGKGGAGPRHFLDRPGLIQRANRGRFVIVQVMSARSESNSLFETEGLEPQRRRSDGRVMSADDAYRGFLRGAAKINLKLGRHEFHFGARRSPAVARLVAETRDASVASHLELLAAIRKPVILLYFSKRRPDYRASQINVHLLFGDFPQLVTGEMVTRMRAGADRFVACVSRRGGAPLLRDRETGAPVRILLSEDNPIRGGAWTRNLYYPTPEMHEDAAKALAPVCREVLAAQPV